MTKSVLALDVGVHTGVAAAIISKRSVNLCMADTLYEHPNTLPTAWWKEVIPQFDVVVVEYPQPNNFSRDIKRTLAHAAHWRLFLLSHPHKIEVQPGTWKNSPAKIWDPLNIFWPKPRKRVPTKHELDACKMLYWFSLTLKAD